VPRKPAGTPTADLARLETGVSARATLEVGAADTATAMGTGDVAVLATPRLVALCEEASHLAVAPQLTEGRTSVASRIQFDHLAAVPPGARVTADATLVRVEGRRLTFVVSASLDSDACGTLVGAGRLTRVLVDRASFLAKARADTDPR
jgi:predicted thioesterase